MLFSDTGDCSVIIIIIQYYNNSINNMNIKKACMPYIVNSQTGLESLVLT